jgi:polysaccharide pyruvyl transferase WcaK-like protein
MAFALEPFPPSRERLHGLQWLEESRPLVGLNISGLLYMGGYDRANMFNLRSDYHHLIAAIIRRFVQQRAHVLLVSHVFGNGDENDTAASEKVYTELRAECGDRLHLLKGDFGAQELKWIIGRCDFFLGSRMHACIAALSQCLPAVGLAYSRKFHGVFASVNVPQLVIDLRSEEMSEVMRRIEELFQERGQFRERLAQTIPTARRTVFNLFAELLSNTRAKPLAALR